MKHSVLAVALLMFGASGALAKEYPIGKPQNVAGMDIGAVSRLAVTDPTVKFLIAPYMREKPLT